jgi:hypothetical protein
MIEEKDDISITNKIKRYKNERKIIGNNPGNY